jgi:hypothetical protein
MVTLGSSSNAIVKNLTIADNYIHSSATDPNDPDSSSAACISMYPTAGNNVTITGNTCHDARYGIFHQPSSSGSSNVTISGNTMYNIDGAVYVAMGDSGRSLNGFYVYGNDIHDFSNWNDNSYTFHHDGIHSYETGGSNTLTNCFVYNNYWHGDFGHGTALNYFESPSGIGTCYYFNNIYAPTAATGGNGFGGLWTQGASSSVTVYSYNNTFTGGGLATYNALWIELTGINETIENNIIYNVGGGLNFCSTTALPTSDHNLWNTSTNGSMFVCSTTPCPSFGGGSFAGWQGVGEDAHGSSANPMLNPDFTLQAGSPAIGLGINLHSICNGQANPGLGALCYDKNGAARPSGGSWDAGAYQRGGGDRPAPPTSLTATAQ